MSVEKQVAIIFAANAGELDKLPVDSMGKFQTEYIEFLEAQRPAILENLRSKQKIDDDLDQEMRKALSDFLKMFKP